MGDTTKPNRSGHGPRGKTVISNDPRHISRRAFSTRRQSAVDLELQDWVVQKLQLSSSKLPQKDLNRISTLASVYCRIKNLKGILATKYKEDDIFKKSSECKSPKKVNKSMTAAKSNGSKDKDEKNYGHEELKSDIHQDVSDQESVKELQGDDVQDNCEVRARTAQSQTDLTPVETVETMPGCSKDFDHQPAPALSTSPVDYPKPMIVEPMPDCPKDPNNEKFPISSRPLAADDTKPGTSAGFEPTPGCSKGLNDYPIPMTVEPTPGCSKDPNNEKIPTSSRRLAEDDPKPGTSAGFEPTPGCSKDPDVPPRSFSKASRKSNLSTLSSKSTKSEPIPSSDYVDPFFRRSRTPDLRPDLEDESLPPNRRTLIPEIPSSHGEEEDPGKVKVDSDLMEMALFIHLAMKKRTRALQAIIDAQ